MNFKIISPDHQGRLDGVLKSQMLDFLPQSENGIPFVSISYPPDFIFDRARMNGLEGKKWVFCDMTENGHDWDQQKSNVFGTGMTHQYGHFSAPGWKDFDDWIRDHPPLITFKRELKLSDKSPRMMPIEHLCYMDIPPVQSKAEFDSRSIEANHTWGYSHPSRVRLHADIFMAMATMNLGVISELNHLDGYFKNPSPRTMASIYKPWYSRSPMPELMAVQQRSKITVSLPGAGKKCFRSAEACVGSIMALHYDALAWSYPWNDGENCIRLEPGHEFRDLNAAAQRANLYDIYVAGQETLRRYESRNYVTDYILPTIQSQL